MQITVIDALGPGRITGVVRQTLTDTGWLHAWHTLSQERFSPCVGCFRCWTKHPGQCRAADAADEVMSDLIHAEAVLWLTRPRFGAWDPLAKVALDKSMGLLSPFTTTVDGETVHQPRYARYPRWAVLALGGRQPGFEALVARNARTFQSGHASVHWMRENASDGRVDAHVLAALASLQQAPTEAVPLNRYPHQDGLRWATERPPAPRVVLWVGSAKAAGTSASEALGGALLRRLERWGWQATTVRSAGEIHLGRGACPTLLAALRDADLLVVAAPVYVDSLPSLVLRGLSLLVDDPRARPLAVLPLIQCGFPEVEHTEHAVRVVRDAADEAGWDWAGQLVVGAGPVLLDQDLDTDPRFAHLARALDEAAVQLDQGRCLSAGTEARFAAPLMPAGAYRTLGQLGWVAAALRNGTLDALWDAPYEPWSPPSRSLEV